VEIEIDPYVTQLRSRRLYDVDEAYKWNDFWRWPGTGKRILGKLMSAGKRVLTAKVLYRLPLQMWGRKEKSVIPRHLSRKNLLRWTSAAWRKK
jgi:hypothetical protein